MVGTIPFLATEQLHLATWRGNGARNRLSLLIDQVSMDHHGIDPVEEFCQPPLLTCILVKIPQD
jgi:hypothetical protein